MKGECANRGEDDKGEGEGNASGERRRGRIGGVGRREWDRRAQELSNHSERDQHACAAKVSEDGAGSFGVLFPARRECGK